MIQSTHVWAIAKLHVWVIGELLVTACCLGDCPKKIYDTGTAEGLTETRYWSMVGVTLLYSNRERFS